MPRLVAKNDAVTTLASAVLAGDDHIHVATGTGTLFGAAGDWMMRIGTSRTAGEFEYVRATAITDDTITVTRAQAGTTAIAHAKNTVVWSCIDATAYDELWAGIDLCLLISNLDNTAGGTDAATTKAPTSNVLYDLARDVLAYDTTPVLRGDLDVGAYFLASSGAIGLKPSGDLAALISFSTVSSAPTITVTGNLDVISSGVVSFKVEGDNDNYIEFTTTSNVPYLKTDASMGIYAGTTVIVSPMLQIGRDDTGVSTSAVTDGLILQMACGSSNSAAGQGFGISVLLGNASSETEERASIDFVLTTATNGAEVAKMTLNLATGAGVAEALSIDYDGTKTSLVPLTGKYLRIGDAGTTSHTLAANDDLFVSGKFEVDGVAYFDAGITSIGIYLGNGNGISTLGVNDNTYSFLARDNGVAQVIVGKVISAADPYFSIGRDDTGVATNAVTDMLVLQAGAGTNNEAAGFGFGLSVKLGNDASEVEERASIDFTLATATNGSEDANMVISLMSNGTMATIVTFYGDDKQATFAGEICATNFGWADGTLTAGLANAFGFTWQNPHAYAIIVYEIWVDVTTAGGTALSVMDVGSAADATTHSDDMLDGIDLNAVAFYVSSGAVKLDAKNGTTDYITGQILVANASSLVGKWYIRYRAV